MTGLYENVTSKSEKVATFLAVLELTKSGRIYINDDNTEIRFVRKTKKNTPQSIGIEDDINTEVITERNKIDEIEEDIDEAFSEPDDISQSEEYEHQNSETPVYKKNKPSVKSISERVYQPHIVSEVDTADKYDKPSAWCNSDNSDDTLKNEIELFEQNETAVTIFKPNYWSERRYYWGYSNTGGDNRNNFWRYG